MTDIHFKSNSNEWATPQYLFDKLNEKYNFTLDPCSTEENHKCDKYYTIKDDGINQSWKGEIVFMNPPYGREIIYWMEKAYNENLHNHVTIVCLVPSRTDTIWWWQYACHHQIEFIKGRLKFGGHKNSAPFPSAIIHMI